MISSAGPLSSVRMTSPSFRARGTAATAGTTAQLSGQLSRQEKNSSSRDIWSRAARGTAAGLNQKECQRSYSGFQGRRSSLDGSS